MNDHADIPWFRMYPRMNATEYLAFVTELMAHVDSEEATRQKVVEELISVPFSLIGDEDDGAM